MLIGGGKVQRDVALLKCELWNCHLRKGETSVGQMDENTVSFFRFYLKRISGSKKIKKVSENLKHIQNF